MNETLEKSKFYSPHHVFNKDKVRDEFQQIRKEERNHQIVLKRFCGTKEDKVTEGFSEKKVQDIAEKFQKHSKSIDDELRYLREAFSTQNEFVDAFINVNNALHALAGYLTCRNSTLQLEAAWVITNMTAVNSKHIMRITKSCAPYCITYLQGSSLLMQEQSALTLGNLASNGANVCSLLCKQGVVLPLLNIVKVKNVNLLTSALYAITNITRYGNEVASILMRYDLHKTLLELLADHTMSVDTIGEVGWLMMYMMRTEELSRDIIIQSRNMIPLLCFWIHKLHREQKSFCFVVTPLIRCLGNMVCCDSVSCSACEIDDLIRVLINLIHCDKIYLMKEALWVFSNVLSRDVLVNNISLELLVEIVSRSVGIIFKNDEISKEVIFCLHNLLPYPQIRHQLITDDVIHNVVHLLKCGSTEDMIRIILNLIEAMLNCINSDVFSLLASSELSTILENLVNNSSETIQERAVRLTEHLSKVT